MAAPATEHVRNIALVGQDGSGKTSLAEAMLYVSGKTPRMGTTHDGKSYLDYDPEEIKRKFTMATSIAPIPYKDYKINLLDTSGHPDFIGDALLSMQAAETALTQARTEYLAAQESLIEGIADVTALDAQIKALTERINAYETETDRLRGEAQRTSNELAQAVTRAETTAQEAETAAKNSAQALALLNAALEARGATAEGVKAALRTQERHGWLQSEISSYKTSCEENEKNLNELKAELENVPEPDESRFEARQSEIANEQKNYFNENSRLGNDIDRLKRKQTTLEALAAEYDANIHSAESDLAFARRLRGESGIGLQRYVLAILFDQVIGEANRMLKRVHGGRYTLRRTDEKGEGNKRGLELKVRDSRSPEKDGRSVSMLSGGEKFLVSLALSIGMSAAAQRSGVQIEALFIDEGFGTLDENSIQDAMEVLESVRKGNGMIGIISHVHLLEANIPTHLEVVKTEAGSHIRVS